jgi:Flp pilus assembly protein TadD
MISRRSKLAVVTACLALATSGCAMFQPSPLAQAQKDALQERERVARATPVETDRLTTEERLDEGDRFRTQGRSDQAMLSYLAAVRMDPTSAEAKERIGFVHLASDLDRADAIFSRLVEEDDANETAWRGLGLTKLAQGQLKAAEEALTRAVELDPNSAGARYALAAALGLMGRPDEALEYATRAQEIRPSDAHIENVIGMSRLLLEDYPLAEASFRRAVRLAPRLTSFANNLGLALGLQGRFEEAYAVFLKTGDEQMALNNLGYVHYLRGDHDRAIEHFERALAAAGDEDVLIVKNLNAAVSARARRSAGDLGG